jgi:aminoglycoside phosphotransferase (APT) family kinase protein
VPEPEGAPVLLWGDVRPGNIIWTDDADVRAVLDWDMTAVGAREHDVAWLTTLEETMAALSRRTLPGQLDRAATVEHYEQVSGHALTDLAWYEVLAMVRSTAIMSRIAYLDRAAGRPLHFPLEDNPLLDLLEQRVART